MRNLATTKEVAEYLNVSIKTMANWACQGTGPEFSKLNGQRRYNWADVERFVAERKVSHA